MPLQIGTQTFAMVVDTGSPDTWVASGGQWAGVSPQYELSETSTLASPVERFLKYGTGWSMGFMYRELIAVPNMPGEVNFTLIAATLGKMHAGPRHSSCANIAFVGVAESSQGLIGFSVGDEDWSEQKAFLEALTHDALIDRPLLALNLCNYGGEAWLGAYDPQASLSPPLMVPATTSPDWTIKIHDLQINNQSMGLQTSALVDTGASLLYVPSAQYRSVVDAIAPFLAGLFPDDMFSARRCEVAAFGASEAAINAQLPTLTLLLQNNVSLTLPASLSYLAPYPGPNGTQWCSHLSQHAVGPAKTVFGAGAMRGLTVIFDQSGEQIGFAAQDRSRCPPGVLYAPNIAESTEKSSHASTDHSGVPKQLWIVAGGAALMLSSRLIVAARRRRKAPSDCRGWQLGLSAQGLRSETQEQLPCPSQVVAPMPARQRHRSPVSV